MDSMEKRVVVAIVLSVLILVGWQAIFLKWSKPPQKVSEVVTQQERAEEQKKDETTGTFHVPEKVEETEVVVEGDLYRAVFSTYGAALKSWKLKKYPIDMITQAIPGLYPLSVELTDGQFEDVQKAQYDLIEKTDQKLVFLHEGNGIRIERTYFFDSEKYSFKNTTKIWLKNKTFKGDFLIGTSEGYPTAPKGNIFTSPYSDVRNYIYNAVQKTHRKTLSSLVQEENIRSVIDWAGVENRYFVTSFINESDLKPYLVLSSPLPGMGSVRFQYPFQKDPQREYFEINIKGYFGPKEVSLLKQTHEGLEQAINFGIFGVICIPLLKIMNLFHDYVIHNYGLAIIFLTLLIRVIFYPLTKKSYVSMREMQRIQPQIAKLKEKYKEDRQELNKQIMDLMKTNKVNPLGGCLPLVVQMPIFFALYRLLYNAIELYRAPFFGWIKDLSAKDPYYVTPILMGVAMFFQQKMTPSTTMDPAQQKAMLIMPVVFSVFMITLPSGLVLYILFSTVLQLYSQYLVNREFVKKGL